jgi:hypothetical protein
MKTAVAYAYVSMFTPLGSELRSPQSVLGLGLGDRLLHPSADGGAACVPGANASRDTTRETLAHKLEEERAPRHRES